MKSRSLGRWTGASDNMVAGAAVYAVPLDKLISRWVGPEVVGDLHLAVLKAAWSDKQRCEDQTVNWVGHDGILLIVFA